MENELLTKLYGEFCSMRGEMCEFKNRTLERLGALETSLKKSSAEKAARICQIVSIGTGAVALASAGFAVLKAFLGGSSPSGSDCSGSVCSAVSHSLGIRLRVTADELYRRFFAENVKSFCNSNFLYAAFFLDAQGRAVHVAGWCGACYVNVSRLEENKCGAFRSESEMKLMYSHLRMVKRGLAV